MSESPIAPLSRSSVGNASTLSAAFGVSEEASRYIDTYMVCARACGVRFSPWDYLFISRNAVKSFVFRPHVRTKVLVAADVPFFSSLRPNVLFCLLFLWFWQVVFY